jgi:hypothetical protein
VNGRGPGSGAATQRKDGGGPGPVPGGTCKRPGSEAGSGATEAGVVGRRELA